MYRSIIKSPYLPALLRGYWDGKLWQHSNKYYWSGNDFHSRLLQLTLQDYNSPKKIISATPYRQLCFYKFRILKYLSKPFRILQPLYNIKGSPKRSFNSNLKESRSLHSSAVLNSSSELQNWIQTFFLGGIFVSPGGYIIVFRRRNCTF